MSTYNTVSAWSHAGSSDEAASQGALSRAIVLFGRFLFVAIFLMSGPFHFSQAEIAAGAIAGVRWPGLLVPLSGVIAFLGALSILVGYHAKIGAWLLVLFLVPVTLTMHNFWSANNAVTVQMHLTAQIQMVNFMKNASMIGCALLISQLGAGPASLDARRSASR